VSQRASTGGRKKGGETMAEMMMPNPKSAFMVAGVLAIAYGVINYLTSVMGWQPYLAWIAGGVLLLLASWAKGSMKD